MTPRTVLVTGAGGALGRFLVPALRESGWRVRALVHRNAVGAADESVRGDLLDPPTLAAATADVDAIVHAAAVTHARDPARYAAVNVGGTAALAAAAADAGVGRLLLLGSRAVGAGGGAYSDSKRDSEEVVRGSGVAFTIVRLPEVYGAGGREGIDRMIEAARKGRPILLVGSGADEVSPVHVEDAVAALVRALETSEASGRTYTLAGPRLTMREAAVTCREVFRSRSAIVPVPEPALRGVAALSRLLPLPIYPDQLDRLRAPRPAPSPEAEADLGFRPRSFAEGLWRLQSAA